MLTFLIYGLWIVDDLARTRIDVVQPAGPWSAMADSQWREREH